MEFAQGEQDNNCLQAAAETNFPRPLSKHGRQHLEYGNLPGT